MCISSYLLLFRLLVLLIIAISGCTSLKEKIYVSESNVPSPAEPPKRSAPDQSFHRETMTSDLKTTEDMTKLCLPLGYDKSKAACPMPIREPKRYVFKDMKFLSHVRN